VTGPVITLKAREGAHRRRSRWLIAGTCGTTLGEYVKKAVAAPTVGA
jgi:hypothetical protein